MKPRLPKFEEIVIFFIIGSFILLAYMAIKYPQYYIHPTPLEIYDYNPIGINVEHLASGWGNVYYACRGVQYNA